MEAKTRSEVSGHFPWIATLALTAVAMVIWAIAPLDALVGFLTLLVCVVIGLQLAIHHTGTRISHLPEAVQDMVDLAGDSELASVHSLLACALKRVSRQNDLIFRQLALSRLETVTGDCQCLGNGQIEFRTTESWRVAYEELLRSPGLHLYRSVAHVESAHYWQDGPGQQSTQLNLELHDAGIIGIERIAVVADHLWSEGERFPVEPVHQWLEQQHRYGIRLRLVRESALGNDKDLLCDFGIYGSRAVGIQTTDPAGRTARFVLDFNFKKVQEAEAAWDRLEIYAVPYGDLLDRQT